MTLFSLKFPNNIVKFLLIVIIMQHFTSIVMASGDNPDNETDHNALLAIKSQLVDHPEGVLSSWNHSLNHCSWEGVTCGRKHSRVIMLDLSSRGLVGTISPFIGNMSFLKQINLYNNSLHGEIPPALGRLFRLQSLELHNNTLVGEIPTNISLCITLETLSLGFNKLEGKLPTEYKALVNLKYLGMHTNNFTGPIFDIISNLTSLQTISASFNQLTGTIPTSIGSMKNLTKIVVGKNKLSGRVPTSIFNLSSLEELELEDNQFRGQLPADIGITLPRIRRLNLGSNEFTGSIPISISNMTNLQFLGLDTNNFTGNVPHDFGRLKSLWYLSIAQNQLVGDISFINTLVNCTQLEDLELSNNDFTGTLPKSIANLSSLSWLAIGGSPISGEIPGGISNLYNLVSLFIFGAEITGPIPHDLGKLPNLESVDLSFNRLTGPIPSSLGNLSQLGQLFLGVNHLQGSIPPSLGACQNLIYLSLYNNELNGTVPGELIGGSAQFVEMNLAQNHLEGSLPSELSKQLNLVMFGVPENKLSGEIPDGLGDCPALQFLDMHSNNFHGTIPASFAALGSLETLDLSRNNLSGPVPAYLSKFPLDNLNLSYNNFEGRVPSTGKLSNVSVVSLVGNIRLCGGNPELHLPRCTEQTELKVRRKRRISRALLVVICALVGVLILATLLYLTCYRRKRKSVSLDPEMREAFVKVSYNMLVKTTNGFSSENLLGAGTFGSVFRGTLEGKTVAVKVLNLQHHGASKSFMAECKALRNIRHRNLVRIITACSSIDNHGNDFKALVYEFMPNGSLDRWLHEARNLSLVQRLDIAIDVANALNYLHHECEVPIVHCDLKPSNVLLDNDMVAHLGDFGLVKFIAQAQHQNQSSSLGFRGTVGYAAQEYGLGSEATTNGDLYSYGIFLLELMTGKRPTDVMFKEDFSLHMYAELASASNVLQIIDPKLDDIESSEDVEDERLDKSTAQQRAECVALVIDVGVACSNHLPQNRMKITDALIKLRLAKEILVK